RLRPDMFPFLALALLLAAAISLMQLGLSPHLRPLFEGDIRKVSHHVALLLSLAAASTLLAQFLVVRPQRLSPRALLLSAAGLMTAGLLLMILPALGTFYAGIAVTTFGAAMATPGYQVLLNDRLTTGKGAGVIATSHTLGYGASALLVPVISLWFGEQRLIVAAFVIAALFLLFSVAVWRSAAPQEPTE
ncbi:MFS transporter, partial [Cronobacter dublinensis subsp. dublinensis]|nr:MFS transporter [Cronobacter dublinensis subsp. dublinensis]